MLSGSRFLGLVGWLTVAVVGIVMLTQLVGWNGTRSIAILQTLTPYLLLLLAPIAVWALWKARYPMAAGASLIGLFGMLLATPLVFAASQQSAAPGALGFHVASVNLLYQNDRIEEVAADLVERDVDAIVFNEYTAEHEAALADSALGATYRYHTDRSDERAGGIAIWTRDRVQIHVDPDTFDHSLDLTVDTPDGPLRIIAIHPPTPVYDFDAWNSDLRIVGQLSAPSAAPTLIIGDFNASYWHPGFRDLLHAGFVDAHIAAGQGFSVSWPVGGALPAFVRLDHALTGNGLVSTDVYDFEIPGSDHRGFVVNVAPTQ